MTKITDALPKLVAEIQRFLVAGGRKDVADQFGELVLSRWTYDAEADALYVYLAGQRPLNVVEENVIGVRHGESIEIEGCAGRVVLDIDIFYRVSGVEIVGREDVKKKLEMVSAMV
jgi:uncharacterized protein YuzE